MMDLHQLRCFVAAAEELHFGRAAQRLCMMPSALGRHIRTIEEDFGTRLLARTTRNVALTRAGAAFLPEARDLLDRADALASRMKVRGREEAAVLRVGAIDSAAIGLLPMILHDFRQRRPDVVVTLVEEKTIRLLPKLLSGRLDLAFVRPPESPDKRLAFFHLLNESAVVAVPEHHRLAKRARLSVMDLADEPLIVPDRRSRPHSHDLTVKLFTEAGLKPKIAQLADEKQTIVNLVAAEIGVAIVPRWTSRMNVSGVRFVALRRSRNKSANLLPLAAAWVGGTRDGLRHEMLDMVETRIGNYAKRA